MAGGPPKRRAYHGPGAAAVAAPAGLPLRSAPGALGSALLGVLLALPASAQVFPWQRHREGLGLTREDLALQREAVQQSLEEDDDGVSREWRNAENGHSGSVTPLRSYEEEGRRCRAFVLRASTRREAELRQRACRHDDGRWLTY